MVTTTRTQITAPRRYETLAAAADRTGISIRTLRRRIADGSLPAYRTGRRIIRVSPQEVDRLMEPMPCGHGVGIEKLSTGAGGGRPWGEV